MIVAMEPDRAALAALAEDVGLALVRYAVRLRSDVAADAVVAEDDPRQEAVTSSAVSPARVSEAVSSAPSRAAARQVPEGAGPRLRRLGASQEKVLDAVRGAGESGATAAQVAAATGLTSTNTPRMLKALAERGLVAGSGANPIIWYAPAS